jgi:hypothetical protein
MGVREALKPVSDDRSRPRHILHHTSRKISFAEGMAFDGATYLEFTLNVDRYGSATNMSDVISHLRTISIDTIPFCQYLMVVLRLLNSRMRNTTATIKHRSPCLLSIALVFPRQRSQHANDLDVESICKVQMLLLRVDE